jgi:prepilin-type N-terminal cleavage/methylation domain-containing protein/prepilin-type processing-associated H-X9-DG protein
MPVSPAGSNLTQPLVFLALAGIAYVGITVAMTARPVFRQRFESAKRLYMRRTERPGFTLIELLVVIAIISILIGMLLSAVQKIRESALRAQCANNLKQIGLALQSYHDANDGFPPGYRASAPYSDGATDTSPGWGWAAYILPYLDQGPLHRQLNFAQPVENSPAIQTMVKTYLCPSDVPPDGPFAVVDAFGNTRVWAAPSSYAATCGPDASDVADPTGLGVFYRNSRTRIAEITDGTSQTVFVGDRAWMDSQGIWAGAPSGAVMMPGPRNLWSSSRAPAPCLVLAHNNWINIKTDADGGLDDFSSYHNGGVNLLFGDGSVHFVNSIVADGQERWSFWALGTRAGGDVVSGLDY